MNALENLILGNTFRDGVKQTVQEAVAEANARNLPKAYEPDFSRARGPVALVEKKNASSHDRFALVNPVNCKSV